MHLHDLEAVGQPALSVDFGQSGPHLVVPPLAALGVVPVAEAHEGVVVVDGGHRAKARPAQVGADVTAPHLKGWTVIVHGLTEDGQHIVDAAAKLLRRPPHEPHATSASVALVMLSNWS